MMVLRSLNVSKKFIIVESSSNPVYFHAVSHRIIARVLGHIVRLPRVKSVPAGFGS